MMVDNHPIPATPATKGSRIPVAGRRIRVGRFYGYFVSLLKLVLPTVALVLIVAVVLWPFLGSQEKRFSVNITKADRESANNILVFNATYTGQTEGEDQFTITSAQTEQTNPDDDVVMLTNPKGDILGIDGTWYAVTANEGLLNKKTGTLELWGDVNAFQDSGMELFTDNVVIDINEYNGYGLDPVTGQGPIGNLKAEGFRIFNKGERIELLGKAKVVILNNGGSS